MCRATDALILVGSLVGLGVYFYLLFLSPWAGLVIQLSAFLAVAVMLLIVAWFGYTMATAPSSIRGSGFRAIVIEEEVDEYNNPPTLMVINLDLECCAQGR